MNFTIAKFKNTKIQKYKISHEAYREKQFNQLDYTPSISKNLILPHP